MRRENGRAFKEWAVVCEALKSGTQSVLLRKGGIREDEGVFTVSDPEFFLMPTYEHQDSGLLQSRHVSDLDRVVADGYDPRTVQISAYALVDKVVTSQDEDALNTLADEFVWNERYVRQRLDYNPYDPLYVLLLRVYSLPEPFAVPMRPDYVGCKSWVTLEGALSTAGAVPAVSDAEFAARRERVLERLRAA